MIRRTFRPYGDGGLIPPRLSVMAWWDRITLQDEPAEKREGPLWEGRNGKEQP